MNLLDLRDRPEVESEKYYGNYRGIVIYSKDPEVRGRCKVHVPGVYPEEFGSKHDLLPWADPVMPLWGGSWTAPSTGDLNRECGHTSPPLPGPGPYEGAQVWVFFEQGNWNYPAYWAAVQAGPGWLSEHKEQHMMNTRNVRLRVDEEPTLPSTARGKSEWKVKLTIQSPVDVQNISGPAIETTTQTFNGLDQRGEFVYSIQVGDKLFQQGKEEPTLSGVIGYIDGLTNQVDVNANIVYYKFKVVETLEKTFTTQAEAEAYVSSIAEGKGSNEVYNTDYTEIPRKEDGEKSTCKFSTYNDQCSPSSLKHKRSDVPTRVDIEIWAPEVNFPRPKNPNLGIALNLQIKGDVNIKVDGDVFEQITGNKHETLLGNLYRHQVGDVQHVLEGNYILEVKKDANKGGSGGSIKIKTDVDWELNVFNDLKEYTLGNRSNTIEGSYNSRIGGDSELRYAQSLTTNIGGGMVDRIGLTKSIDVGGDYYETCRANKFMAVKYNYTESTEMIKNEMVGVFHMYLNTGAYSSMTLIGGIKINGIFGIEMYGMVQTEVVGLAKSTIAGMLISDVASAVTHN